MPKLALIEYFTSYEKTYIFIVRPEDDEPIIIEANITNNRLKECRDLLFGNNKVGVTGRFQVVNPTKPFRTDLSFFQDLAGELIHKYLELVQDYDMLYLIPHGWIHHLPLHILQCEDGQYLIEKFKIIYSPSATVLKYCQSKNKVRQKGISYESVRSCLALGVGKADDPETLKKSFCDEAQYVGKEIFAKSGTCKLDEKASKAFFLENCKNMDVIHLACHGFFNSLNPMKSGLLLADGYRVPESKADKDKAAVFPDSMLLTTEEIFNINLVADLIVLSACVTGVNENKPGDELIGLTRALLYAGSPSVIVSLWSVYSDSTLQLMRSFYKYWTDPKKAVSKAEALQNAQLDMIRNQTNESWQHPYHWAPFVLVGDWI